MLFLPRSKNCVYYDHFFFSRFPPRDICLYVASIQLQIEKKALCATFYLTSSRVDDSSAPAFSLLWLLQNAERIIFKPHSFDCNTYKARRWVSIFLCLLSFLQSKSNPRCLKCYVARPLAKRIGIPFFAVLVTLNPRSNMYFVELCFG